MPQTGISNIPPMPQLGPDQLGRRCLVTGGAGYVGRAIVQRLHAAGCEVRSLDVLPHSHGADIETIAGDLRDAAIVSSACTDIDSVFHTAALINTLSIYRDAVKRKVFAVNVDGTRNVVRAAAQAAHRDVGGR